VVQARTRLSSRLKKVACQLLSACSEACETGNEKAVGVWHAISGIVNNIDRLFLYGFYQICLAYTT